MTKIEKLISKQEMLTEKFQKDYLKIVKTSIQKYGITKSRAVIKKELGKVVPFYVRAGLILGQGWITNG